MKDDRPETSWKFSGKKEHFERFDKMVLRNARLKLGGKLGPQFWNGTLPAMEDMSEKQWAEYIVPQYVSTKQHLEYNTFIPQPYLGFEYFNSM